ncbi:hypothetical protein AB0K18_45440 [Nonomuraea sp. NPDC049421]|uniref:hypothetical protein n=1 Tax=Nonomuraea sp. NPDC049421 TaxID=3155275 RepID=UPI00342F5972
MNNRISAENARLAADSGLCGPGFFDQADVGAAGVVAGRGEDRVQEPGGAGVHVVAAQLAKQRVPSGRVRVTPASRSAQDQGSIPRPMAVNVWIAWRPRPLDR